MSSAATGAGIQLAHYDLVLCIVMALNHNVIANTNASGSALMSSRPSTSRHTRDVSPPGRQIGQVAQHLHPPQGKSSPMLFLSGLKVPSSSANFQLVRC